MPRITCLFLVALGLLPGGLQPTRAVAAAAQARASAPGPTVTLAIVGGRLVDGFGGAPVDDSVILIAGDRIVAIDHVGGNTVPASAKVVDARGMTVLPGLWESHGHLEHVGEGTPTVFPEKFRDRLPEVMANVARVSLMAGITTFRDTGGPLEAQQALRVAIERGEKPGPRLFLAGPIINQRTRSEANTPGDLFVSTPEEAKAAAERLVAMKVDQIKVYGFWDQPVLEEITRAAHAAGLGVDADVRHVEAYRTAIKAGVDRLHHVFTADPLSDYGDEDLRLLVRGDRPTGAGPSANIIRGPYIVPTIEMRNAYARALQFPGVKDTARLREVLPSDLYEYVRQTIDQPQSIPWGVGAVERVKVAKRKLRRFIDAGGREQIVAGCDAGAPLNFHSPLAKEVFNLVDSGLTAMEAIQAATLRPAQMQGVDAQLGTVSVGKLADLIVVDGDPLQDIWLLQRGIAHVIKGGQVVR